jgi:ribose transport system substrate-binding protein
MKKILIPMVYILLIVTILTILYVSLRLLLDEPDIAVEPPVVTPLRVVYITEQLGTPFWDEVQAGAEIEADKHNILVEFWGTYRSNKGELLKNMDLAIASKVDGIVVQGIESEEFKKLVGKASEKGIPVITIATDASSLRKKYVGTDHYQAGVEVAGIIAAKMKGKGKLAIVSGEDSASHLQARLRGIRVTLNSYPEITVVEEMLFDVNQSSAKNETATLLNKHPECRFYIALSGESVQEIVEVISTRNRIKDFSIFTFDDNQETMDLLEAGLIDLTLKHQPRDMGQKSLQLVIKWLEGKEIPLQGDSSTPFEIVWGKT